MKIFVVISIINQYGYFLINYIILKIEIERKKTWKIKIKMNIQILAIEIQLNWVIKQVRIISWTVTKEKVYFNPK